MTLRARPLTQVFSLLTAGLGLAAFALILALVEQVPIGSLPLIALHS